MPITIREAGDGVRASELPPLKFAVVREDPELELELCKRLGARTVLTVASGGCTALTLAARGIRVTAFDINPTQLSHVEAKRAKVAAGELYALNVEDADPSGLNQRGTFEGLFRILRAAVTEFVVPVEAIEEWFRPELPESARRARVEQWFASAYWPAAFTTAFNEGLLHALFGVAATQHAAPGSYPSYFQAAFERGLRRTGGSRNPFLQHVLLGRYLTDDAPEYLRERRSLSVDLVEGSLMDVVGLERFELYSLSNVFDWSGDTLVAAWAERLQRDARPGSAVLIRQLNNRRHIKPFFEPAFQFDAALGLELAARDRSLFYERVEVGLRR